MHYIEWPAKLGSICGRLGVEILERQLDNGWRVNDAAVAFTKATRTGGDGLLSKCKDVAIGPRTALSIKFCTQTYSARDLHVSWPARGLKNRSRFRKVHWSRAMSARRCNRAAVGTCGAVVRRVACWKGACRVCPFVEQ